MDKETYQKYYFKIAASIAGGMAQSSSSRYDYFTDIDEAGMETIVKNATELAAKIMETALEQHPEWNE